MRLSLVHCAAECALVPVYLKCSTSQRKRFGKKRFATLYGLSWTAYAIGGAIGRFGWTAV